MAIKRVFLGWDRPGLAAAVSYLVERFGSPGMLNLQNVVIGVPGARAGRRLLEMLVEEADRRRWVFNPPAIVTAGRLPEVLYEAKRPFADELLQQLAWSKVLCHDLERLRRLTAALPAEGHLTAWLALGEMLARLHRELAAEARDFAAVADRGSTIAGFREAERWRALEEIQKEYLHLLDQVELWDRQTARLYAIRQGECRTEQAIVLVGTVDLNAAQRLMLDQVAEQVTALVVAPAELAGRFDEHGCLRPETWQDVAVELAPGQIEVVGDPAQQAAAVVRAIAAWGGQYSAEQITVGVPDEEVVPYLEQHLQQCDLPVRYGVGPPVVQTAPCWLLSAVADYLDGRRFAAFAALVRHPAIGGWLSGKNIRGDWLSQLDAYYCDHLPHSPAGEWLGPPSRFTELKQVYEAIEGLLGELGGRLRPLQRWSEPILKVLLDVFGGALLDRDVEPDRTVLAACEAIHEVLRSHRAVPGTLAPEVTGADALRLVLGQVREESVPPQPDRAAIELLGWLELPLDDAPALVVTGFNEGVVPSSLNADLFLPNQLRRAMGIEDNDRRYARDAYALSVLAASRQQLKLIAGRRTADGDPLAPSRLLFACDEETAAGRVVELFRPRQPSTDAASLPGALRPGRDRSKFEVPQPRPLAEPVTSMRVTEFRDYLACPYRYYLRHGLGLAPLDDAAEELDGAAFGLLAHAVLRRFGTSEAAASTDPQQILAQLNAILEQIIGEQYGKAPLPAVRVQIEQLRVRLEAFARWQADWAVQGWRIERVEASPNETAASLVVDGRPVYLRGRIDRIDVHQASGRRVILDYKTSDTAKTPEQTHRDGGAWVDLQLPLYRHLLAGLGIRQPVDLGYIVLPKDTSKVGARLAEWAEADLRSADQAAEEVIRKVRAGVFWPPASPPPAGFEEFARICQEGQFGAVLAAAEEEGGHEP